MTEPRWGVEQLVESMWNLTPERVTWTLVHTDSTLTLSWPHCVCACLPLLHLHRWAFHSILLSRWGDRKWTALYHCANSQVWSRGMFHLLTCCFMHMCISNICLFFVCILKKSHELIVKCQLCRQHLMATINMLLSQWCSHFQGQSLCQSVTCNNNRLVWANWCYFKNGRE